MNDSTSPNFATILQSSLFQQITHKATCQSCKHFTTFTSRRSTSSRQLPPILAVNTSVYNDENFAFWQDFRDSTFLKTQISIGGQVYGVDDEEKVLYELRVCSSLTPRQRLLIPNMTRHSWLRYPERAENRI